MVDDLMELEKIEFGGLVLKKEKFNVNNEIQLIFDAQQALLVDKKLSFNNYIGKDIFLNTDKSPSEQSSQILSITVLNILNLKVLLI